jgi:hypothetical protein
MNLEPLTIQTIYAIVIASIVIGILKVIRKRLFRKLSPVVRPEAERELREFLLVAREVFQEVSNSGGYFGHPWALDGIKWQAKQVIDTLHANAVRLGRRRLTRQVSLVSDNLREVRRASHTPPPQIYSFDDLGMRSNDPQSDAWYKTYERQAAIAEASAEVGIHAVEEALRLLDKISKG